MLALFKVEGFCKSEKRIRQLNILLYMSVNEKSTGVPDMLSRPLLRINLEKAFFCRNYPPGRGVLPMKGVPSFNKRYIKGVPFLPK